MTRGEEILEALSLKEASSKVSSLDKNSNNWYKFDDSTCIKCDKNILNNNNPYLLLYEKLLWW